MEGPSNPESPKITEQRRAEYFRVLMQELVDAGGSMRNREARRRLAERLSLTDYERGLNEKRQERWWTTLTLHFIRFSKAQWLDRKAGIWRITDLGRQKLVTTTPLEALEETYRAYQEWEAAQPASVDPEVDEEELTQNIWLIGAGPAAAWWPSFQLERRVFVEFPVDADGKPLGLLSDMSKDQIRSRMVKIRGRDNPMNDVHCAWQFAHEMEPGDLVIVHKGRSIVLGHGVVRGGYECLEEAGVQRHCRAVDWTQLSEVRLPDKYLMPSKTLTEISRYAGFADVMLGHRTPEAMQSLASTTALPFEAQEEYFRGHPYAVAANTIPETRAAVQQSSPSIDDIAEEAFVERVFLQEVLQAMDRKLAIVLQGPPGTGKTWLARQLAEHWARSADRVSTVQFHGAYQYEDFVRGLRPGDGGGFRVQDGPLVEIANRAKGDTGNRYVLLIDEINRGNVAKVLGETLSLVERDKRESKFAVQLGLALGGSRDFWLPPNLAILATMNTADRSIALVDFALRRRFAFFTLKPAFGVGGKLEDWLLDQFAGASDADGAASESEARAIRSEARMVAGTIINTMQEVNRRIAENKLLGERFVLGHSYFCADGMVPKPTDWMYQVFKHDILPMLQEYGADHRALAASLVEPLKSILGNAVL
jgi:5-methylcytosine-specific restriction protein B